MLNPIKLSGQKYVHACKIDAENVPKTFSKGLNREKTYLNLSRPLKMNQAKPNPSVQRKDYRTKMKSKENQNQRLVDILSTIFQLDRGDLDFGIYRIMNQRTTEIRVFLEEELLSQIDHCLSALSELEVDQIQSELATLILDAKRLGVDPCTSTAIEEKKDELKRADSDSKSRAEVFNHLATFFQRHYIDGDFMSLRRHRHQGGHSYMVPYNGEESFLHWTNADQYYVKTSEDYSSYVFVIEDANSVFRVEFEIVDAESEDDDSKQTSEKDRRFVLHDGEDRITIDDDAKRIRIRFNHRTLLEHEKEKWGRSGTRQQDRINETTILEIFNCVPENWRRVLATPFPTDSNPDRTVIEKHLTSYSAKNDFDYFIHKDLRSFLRQELDLYLKNEVLAIDDLSIGDENRLERSISKMRATKLVAEKIIDFLVSIEEFEKRVWLRKKFVTETNYCITIDKVPSDFYAEILENQDQVKEWEVLFGIETDIECQSNPEVVNANFPTSSLFDDHPLLVVDTAHFDRSFKERLIAVLTREANLEDQIDGTFVDGENFQALNLLGKRYRRIVDCIYIDPPYNTDRSPILYKNNYKRSSWLSLMYDRLEEARAMLTSAGVICCAIDDEEVAGLRFVLEKIMDRRLGVVVVRANPVGRKSEGQFTPKHEYALFYGNAGARPGPLEKTEKQLKRYPHIDNVGRYSWLSLIRTGTDSLKEESPSMYFPLYVSTDDQIRVPNMKYDKDRQEYEINDSPRMDELEIFPIVIEEDGTRIQKRWQRGGKKISENPDDYRVRRLKDDEEFPKPESNISIDFKARMDELAAPDSWWEQKKYASSNHGAKILKELFNEKNFDFPKSVNLVEDCIKASNGSENAVILDFFAGSGTTGHAVANLNRSDGGRRKVILIEVGKHFDTVLLPRMKKLCFSDSWERGNPKGQCGQSTLYKYIRLESFEDALNNLSIDQSPISESKLFLQNPKLAEDFMLHHSMEALFSDCVAEKCEVFPGPYTQSIESMRGGVRTLTEVDLPETFNYLLGLSVHARNSFGKILAISGVDYLQRHCLVIWREIAAVNDDEINAWFLSHRAGYRNLDCIFVNGDSTLNSQRRREDSWTVYPIEPLFRELMFESSSVS